MKIKRRPMRSGAKSSATLALSGRGATAFRALAMLAMVGLSPNVQAAFVGSKHDFTNAAWNASGASCTVCHNVMNPTQPPLAPLWDHWSTTSTFVTYDSPSMDGLVGQPGNISRACLSCHDGTVSIDAYGSSAGTGVYMTGSALLGTDLSSSHPIGLTYDNALAAADRGLYPPTTRPAGSLGGTIAQMMLYGTNRDQLECASCHSVHDDANGKFLRITAVGSALCLTCHDK